MTIKNYFFGIFFALATLGAHAHNDGTTPESTQVLPIDHTLCIKQIDTFKKCLIKTIDALYPHLSYWKQIQGNSTTPETAKMHRIALEQEIAIHTYYLGALGHAKHQLSSVKNQEALQEHSNKTTQLMLSCLLFQPENTLEKKSILPQNATTLYNPLISAQMAMHSYTDIALERTKLHHKPGHFKRHWISYTAGTLCTLGALAYMYKNKDALADWLKKTEDSTKLFFTDHLYKPLKNIYDIFYDKNPIESIKISEDGVQQMVYDYLKDNHSSLSNAEIKQKAELAARIRELPKELIDERAKETKNPLLNSLIPNWRITHYFGKGQYVRIQLIDAEMWKISMKELLQTNKLTIELLLTLPAIALLYGSYKTEQIISNKIAPKDAKYKPIRNALLRIEHLLNNHNNNISEMDYSTRGQLCYWIDKLRTDAHHVAATKRIYFLDDIDELESPDLLIAQKLATINRMYRAYGFLQEMKV